MLNRPHSISRKDVAKSVNDNNRMVWKLAYYKFGF